MRARCCLNSCAVPSWACSGGGLKVEGAAQAQTLVTLLDVCSRNGLTRFRIATQLPKRR
jgi:hypothetical protein